MVNLTKLQEMSEYLTENMEIIIKPKSDKIIKYELILRNDNKEEIKISAITLEWGLLEIIKYLRDDTNELNASIEDIGPAPRTF